MKLVLPVSDSDLAMGVRLAKRIVALGEMSVVDVVVISTMRAKWEIETLLEVLRVGVKTVDLHVLSDECEGEGWAESANHIFFGSASYLDSIGNTEPWFYMEMDVFPLKRFWFQELEGEYISGSRPYCGVINVSRYVDLVTGREFEEGQHMVGGMATYPADFFQRCRSIHYLERLPFDVFLGREIASQVLPSKILCHRWGTRRYSLFNGSLVCEDTEHDWHKYAAPVFKEAVCVHGVKDDSLFRLLPGDLEW